MESDERKTVLTQEKCVEAYKVEALMCARLTKVEKTEMVEKTMSIINLCLGNKVLRKFTGRRLWLQC